MIKIANIEKLLFFRQYVKSYRSLDLMLTVDLGSTVSAPYECDLQTDLIERRSKYLEG